MTIHNKELVDTLRVGRHNISTEYIFTDGSYLEETHINNTLQEALDNSKSTMNAVLRTELVQEINFCTEDEGWLAFTITAGELNE